MKMNVKITSVGEEKPDYMDALLATVAIIKKIAEKTADDMELEGVERTAMIKSHIMTVCDEFARQIDEEPFDLFKEMFEISKMLKDME